MKKTNVNQRSNKLFNNPYQQLFPLYGNTFLSKDRHGNKILQSKMIRTIIQHDDDDNDGDDNNVGRWCKDDEDDNQTQ